MISSSSPHQQPTSLVTVSVLISEILNLGPRIGYSSYTSPTVFSHSFQLAPQLEILVHASQEAILNSLAPSLLSAYFTGWNCFKAFHASYHPSPLQTSCLYAILSPTLILFKNCPQPSRTTWLNTSAPGTHFRHFRSITVPAIPSASEQHPLRVWLQVITSISFLHPQ